MIIILSSAKTQKYAPLEDLPVSQPPLLDQTETLLQRCRELSREEIKKLMKVSDKLAEGTVQRFLQFTLPHHTASASPALATFAGDVFAEIRCQDYGKDEFLYAHKHLRILSGLYGVLRPLDLMQPYRLEMGYKLNVGNAANLYEFWAESVTAQLNSDLQQTGSTCVVNCASKEYSRTIAPGQLNGSLMTMTFKQKKNNKISTIAIYAKRARGMFVDWCIKRRLDSPAQLKDFDRGGYRFSPELSADSEFVFVVEM